MGFNFQPVERGAYNFASDFPDNVVRIHKRTISFNDSVTKHLGETRYQTDSGDRVRVGFAYDDVNQAIQVTPSASGFSGAVGSNGSVCIAKPAKLRNSGLPTGDYKLVEGERNIFQLAR